MEEAGEADEDELTVWKEAENSSHQQSECVWVHGVGLMRPSCGGADLKAPAPAEETSIMEIRWESERPVPCFLEGKKNPKVNTSTNI